MVVASEPAIAEAIEKYYTSNVSFEDVMMDFAEEEEEFELEDVEEDLNVLDLEKSAGDAPVVKLVNLILLDAIRKNAWTSTWSRMKSSCGFGIESMACSYEVMKPPVKLKHAITSRLKIMSRLTLQSVVFPRMAVSK